MPPMVELVVFWGIVIALWAYWKHTTEGQRAQHLWKFWTVVAIVGALGFAWELVS